MFGYLTIKHLHLACVGFSILLFTLRGLGVLAGVGFANHRFLRVLSMGIDTLLLVFGVWLAVLLQLNPITVGWLGLKLLLLVAYIVLGTFALKRARSWRAKFLCWLAALATVGLMYGIAKAHHPLGWLRWWGWA